MIQSHKITGGSSRIIANTKAYAIKTSGFVVLPYDASSAREEWHPGLLNRIYKGWIEKAATSRAGIPKSAVDHLEHLALAKICIMQSMQNDSPTPRDGTGLTSASSVDVSLRADTNNREKIRQCTQT